MMINGRLFVVRIFLSLIFLLSANSWAATTVQGLRVSNEENKTRLVFDLNATTRPNVFALHAPERLVIDLPYTQKSNSFTVPDLANSPIKKIRSAKNTKNKLRIVLDLHYAVDYTSQVLKPYQQNGHRLVIDLKNKNITQSLNLPQTQVMQPAVKAIQKAAANTSPPTKKKITSLNKAKPVANISYRPQARRDIVIAIDAGHGGKDSGAVGSRGTKEKDVVLSIARRLAKLVDAELGMRAYLTRNSDTFISLRGRIKRAHDQKADMFISIHADSFKRKSARGASVYVLSERGASSEAAKMLADKENASDLVGGISLENKDKLLASVLLDLSQEASLQASTEVAETVLSGLKRVGHVHKKRVESAAFVVLKSPDIPSLLVETAFISNSQEELKLRSPKHQQKLARAIQSGIRNYFLRYPPPGTGLPQQHIVSSGDTLSGIAQQYQISLAQLKSTNRLNNNRLKVGDVLKIP